MMRKNHPTSNSGSLRFLGLYPKPTLTAYPGPIMAPGESLNFRCQGPIYGMTFALIRLEDLEKSFYLKRPIKNEAYFFFRALKIHDAGHYLCLYYDGSYRGSLLSDILKIWVTGKRGGCFGIYVGGKGVWLSLGPLESFIMQPGLMVGEGAEFL